MKNRLCVLLLTFCLGLLLYGQETTVYVPATEEDVVAGGDFILASSGNLQEAYVGKGFSSDETYFVVTKDSSQYGVLKIGAKRKDGYCTMKMDGESVGIKYTNASSKSDLSTSEEYYWYILPFGKPGLFRIINKRYNDESDNPRRLQFHGTKEENIKVANYTDTVGSEGCFDGDIYLFKKVTGTTVTVSESGFATLYKENAFRMPDGLTGGIITGAASEADMESGADYVLSYNWRYGPGTVVPANTALILRGEKGTYSCVETESAEPLPAGNLLHGTVNEHGLTDCGDTDAYYYYKLAYGGADNAVLGFWWGADGGAPFANAAGKAYLAIPQTLASRVSGFSLPETVSGISCISLENARKRFVYDFHGRRVRIPDNGAAVPALLSGLYIVDGKKVWIK